MINESVFKFQDEMYGVSVLNESSADDNDDIDSDNDQYLLSKFKVHTCFPSQFPQFVHSMLQVCKQIPPVSYCSLVIKGQCDLVIELREKIID